MVSQIFYFAYTHTCIEMHLVKTYLLLLSKPHSKVRKKGEAKAFVREKKKKGSVEEDKAIPKQDETMFL